GTQSLTPGPERTPDLAAFEAEALEKRYETRTPLGEGGMGEVFLCRDARIGRDVAMKVARSDRGSSAELRARFLREVRVQGQLEHPSIVPVYDLGVGKDGATYFTMKRVKGHTLAEILDRLRSGDRTTAAQFSQRQLLAAFQSVCLAIEYAHSRGVLHRDLKPTNIMLGAFGEVYVLDWGIAKIMAEEEAPNSRTIESNPSLDTQVGTFVGTLGYSAPEQLQNEALGPRSDVFSLGAILFEILTFRPLYDGPIGNILKQMSEEPDARCSVRCPSTDVPPELETICVQTTKAKPEERTASARDLNDAIGRFLDGDRDLERRRILAEDHRLAARAEKLITGSARQTEEMHRAKALGELGRALALDPTNEAAMGDIVELLLAPPLETPAEVRRQLNESQLESISVVGRSGAWSFFFGAVLLVPVLFDIRPGYRLVGLFMLATALAAAVISYAQIRSPSQHKSYFVMAACALCYLAMSRLYGPFMLVPSVVMATSMIYGMHPHKRVQRASLFVMLGSIALPVVLELVHVWLPTYAFTDNGMMILPRALAFARASTMTTLFALTVFLIYAGSVVIQRARNALTNAEERLLVHAWQFRQLVPAAARVGVKPAAG
ncbi:MAG: serine/threonine-protein kinase, partial [Polyangiaceae bacterium]